MNNQATTCIGCPFEKASDEQCRYVCQNCNGYKDQSLHVLIKQAIENYKRYHRIWRIWSRPNDPLYGGVFGCDGCGCLGEQMMICWSCPGHLGFETKEDIDEIADKSCSSIMNILSPPEKKSGLLRILFDWFWE